MLRANAMVLSRWSMLDQAWLGRHKRRFRVRTLYPQESIRVAERHRETPAKGSPILKIVKRTAGGLEMQAALYFDKAVILAALATDEAIPAAWDLLDDFERVDVRDAEVLAEVRSIKGRLQ
jgi:hypothetical protein